METQRTRRMVHPTPGTHCTELKNRKLLLAFDFGFQLAFDLCERSAPGFGTRVDPHALHAHVMAHVRSCDPFPHRPVVVAPVVFVRRHPGTARGQRQEEPPF
eukprot:3376922-Rhodomonas_salina.2